MVVCFQYNRLFLFKSILTNVFPSYKWYSRTPVAVRYRAQSKALIKQKIDTPEYRTLLTPSLLKLVELFKSNQHELRVAGGAVRDILMGINPHDVDFATTATPEQVKTMLNEANIRLINANGEKHGTITARIDDKDNFEVTTLRVDLATDGRHAVVEYTQDWQLDASRRDLTINALFLDFEGVVYDYFNGIDDLEHRRIRFVGDPVERIREDYLRILRYFRFFGRLANDNATHDEETLRAIRENANGLQNISGERLWVELKRTAEGRNAGSVLRKMLEQNIGQYLGIPSDVDLNQIEDHWRKCHHAKPEALTILTKLFRDMNELSKFEQRMKYSNECRRLSQLLVAYRDSISILDPSSTDPLKPYKDLLIDLYLFDPMIKEKIIELLKYQYHLHEVQQLTDWTIPNFPISAGMLALKGVKQGPNYKTILNELRQAWKNSHFKATENELLTEILPKVLKNLSTIDQSTIIHQKTIVNPPAFALPKRRKHKDVSSDNSKRTSNAS
ncbi:unnamed protein product [Rotaria socialis]|uniref:Uncharacterized protein n=1 Tax=Rotaria socialis TaxID=392032 RepID=A0A817ZUW2_9BILA|nr:unnamed protein product [Rotaria socialis]CAF3543511.1 unnamed protein product [Rotaria socialis]CAF3549406.1 unnamed protein product [Rotaria socialis]CAF3586710.1 unnamed protein product [Rotaria socialis]CAF4429586.1 unnamed protein product [Rotaria socialis]